MVSTRPVAHPAMPLVGSEARGKCCICVCSRDGFGAVTG
ncbi:hypothetical protein SCALM49S_10251 [Streptomyces californicus]